MKQLSPALRMIAICAISLLNGCAMTDKMKSIDGPVQPAVFQNQQNLYTPKQMQDDEAKYNSQILQNDLTGARVTRDNVIQSVRNEIEIVYSEFERNLFVNKASFEIESDIFELFLSTATTLTTAQRARTNLSALLTGFKGSRLSVDKNIFREQTFEILTAQMRAARSSINSRILSKLLLDVTKYPLAEAKIDLAQLFNAGTLHEALIELSNQAGGNAKTAADIETRAAGDRILELKNVSANEKEQIDSIRKKFNELFRNKNTTKAKSILKKLDSSVNDDLSDKELWEKLNAHIKKANDTSYLPTLLEAFELNK